MQVFIYNGEGASEFCVKETLKTFSSMGCAPQLIYSDTLGVLSVPKEIFIKYFLLLWIKYCQNTMSRYLKRLKELENLNSYIPSTKIR